MTVSKAVEHRITRELLRRRQGGPTSCRANRLAERLITAAAVAALLVLTGSYLQELLWVGMFAGAVLTLGTRSTL